MNETNSTTLGKSKNFLIILVTFIVLCPLLIWYSNSLVDKEIGSIEIVQTSNNIAISLTDEDTINKFMNALNNREKTNAQIDIRPNDYSVNILYTDNSMEEYSLWVDDNIDVRGVLMKGNQTWFINKVSNSIFKEVLNNDILTFKGENEDWTAEYTQIITDSFLNERGYDSYKTKQILTVTYKKELYDLTSVKNIEISYETPFYGGSRSQPYEDNPIVTKTFCLCNFYEEINIANKEDVIKTSINVDGKVQTLELTSD